jgi:hypothetical protein
MRDLKVLAELGVFSSILFPRDAILLSLTPRFCPRQASTSGSDTPKIVRNPFRAAQALASSGAGKLNPNMYRSSLTGLAHPLTFDACQSCPHLPHPLYQKNLMCSQTLWTPTVQKYNLTPDTHMMSRHLPDLCVALSYHIRSHERLSSLELLPGARVDREAEVLPVVDICSNKSDPEVAGSALGGPVSTLDAKKAYRANRGAQHRVEQQKTAAEQARASPTLAAKQAARLEQKEEIIAQQEAVEADANVPW